MNRYWENREQQRRELGKIYREPANLRLKYLAIGAFCVTIALFLIIIIWMEELSWKAMLILRGSAGAFAIIGMIITAILLYRVNSAYIHRRRPPKK